MSRPESLAPPEVFYDESEAKKYSNNSRINEIQRKMSERALELLLLPNKNQMPEGEKFSASLVLDIGCGSGISGEVIEEYGHYWMGVDISKSMLDVAYEKRTSHSLDTTDLVVGDMGQGLPWRIGVFDAAISISAVQWLCNADKKNHNPRKRLKKFFNSLYASLRRGGRAVFQFYPESSKQLNMITEAALVCGFSGGVVVDFPNSTRAKKYFLVLSTGSNKEINTASGSAKNKEKAEAKSDAEAFVLPKAKTDEDLAKDEMLADLQEHTIEFLDDDEKEKRKQKSFEDRKSKGKVSVKSKEWIKRKKAVQRLKGVENVRPDTKYTGKKRSGKF